MAARGYGITQQDMDASRLVFVSVQSAKPRRKVAVPVPDGYTWQDFLQQVQQKLKLTSVESIVLASSGEKITNLDDLQDIDELHVTESKAPAPNTSSFAIEHPPGNGHAGPTGSAAVGPAPMQSSRADSDLLQQTVNQHERPFVSVVTVSKRCPDNVELSVSLIWEELRFTSRARPLRCTRTSASGNVHTARHSRKYAKAHKLTSKLNSCAGANASTSQSPPLQGSKRGLPPAVPLPQPSLSDRHRSAAGDTEPSRLHTETDSEPDQEDKYVKRKGSVKRSLQRVMPTMFQPTLPVTTRDVQNGKAGSGASQPNRRRRRRQQWFSLRNLFVLLVLIGILGTMVFLYSKVQPTVP